MAAGATAATGARDATRRVPAGDLARQRPERPRDLDWPHQHHNASAARRPTLSQWERFGNPFQPLRVPRRFAASSEAAARAARPRAGGGCRGAPVAPGGERTEHWRRTQPASTQAAQTTSQASGASSTSGGWRKRAAGVRKRLRPRRAASAQAASPCVLHDLAAAAPREGGEASRAVERRGRLPSRRAQAIRALQY